MKSRSLPVSAIAAALTLTVAAPLATSHATAPRAPAAANTTPTTAPAQPANAAPAVSDGLAIPDAPKPSQASAWLVMDYATGEILAGENIDMQLEPASITKVLTSYVIAAEMAAGKISADDQVLMSENAWRRGGARTDGSYSGFEVNKTAPLIEMEKGMVVQSGNDASIALAEHVAGSEAAFAQLMNVYAAKIGMTNSHFVNPHGLPDEAHLSTARDLAILGRALIRDFPEAYAYNSIKEFTVGPITQPNRNLLLWRDASVDGIKTGHTARAGYCLMASAQRGEQRLISVVMGAGSENQRANDSQALLNWGFRFYETNQLYAANTEIATHQVWKGKVDEVKLGLAQPLLVSMPRGRYAALKPMMDIPKVLEGPIEAGQVIGTVRVELDGKEVAQAPLVALEAVEEAGFFKRLWHSLLMWWNG